MGNINKTKKQAILAALVVVDVSSVCIYYSLQVDFVGFVVGLLVLFVQLLTNKTTER